jgi:sec-independent protein translocase protein TatA
MHPQVRFAGAREAQQPTPGAHAMLSQIGPMEIVLVLVVALLVLGPKRLPEAGRSLGRGIREFKDSITGADKDERDGELAAASSQPAPAERETTQP